MGNFRKLTFALLFLGSVLVFGCSEPASGNQSDPDNKDGITRNSTPNQTVLTNQDESILLSGKEGSLCNKERRCKDGFICMPSGAYWGVCRQLIECVDSSSCREKGLSCVLARDFEGKYFQTCGQCGVGRGTIPGSCLKPDEVCAYDDTLGASTSCKPLCRSDQECENGELCMGGYSMALLSYSGGDVLISELMNGKQHFCQNREIAEVGYGEICNNMKKCGLGYTCVKKRMTDDFGRCAYYCNDNTSCDASKGGSICRRLDPRLYVSSQITVCTN